MSMRNYINIYDLSLPELQILFGSWEEAPYRAAQVWDGLYKQLWSSTEQFSNIPNSLRIKLNEYISSAQGNSGNSSNFSGLRTIRTIKSRDGETTKNLFSLKDGQQIESVLMRYENRRTLCVSTQAGCAMGCVFCATGQMGFMRNLSSGEIIEQVLFYARMLKEVSEHVTNVVVMGMGEPFHNYDATLEAIRRLNDPDGFNLGARRFTISSVGIVPAIQRFTDEHNQVNLAISLHSADNDLRSQLLPINNKYPIEVLLAACLDYIKTTHRRISFEWALIEGVNDTPEQARLLVERLTPFRSGRSILCHVNIIQLNPTKKYSGSASSRQRAVEFQEILTQAGIPCTIRLRRGIEIQAGCGQLASK